MAYKLTKNSNIIVGEADESSDDDEVGYGAQPTTEVEEVEEYEDYYEDEDEDVKEEWEEDETMVDHEQPERKSSPEIILTHVSSSDVSSELPVVAATGPISGLKITNRQEGNQNITSDTLATNPNRVYLPGTVSKNTNLTKSTSSLSVDGTAGNETRTTPSLSTDPHMHTKGRSHSAIDKPESIGDDQKEVKDNEDQTKSKKTHKFNLTAKSEKQMQVARFAFHHSLAAQATALDTTLLQMENNIKISLQCAQEAGGSLRAAKIKTNKLKNAMEATDKDPKLSWLHQVKVKPRTVV